MPAPDTSLISKLAKRLQTPPRPEAGTKGSVLELAANSYGFRAEVDELTQPTGFDPGAARLFEALVESAYLVANADGKFGEADRSAFVRVVLAACTGLIAERQVRALLLDLGEQLAADGLEKRIEVVARAVTKPEHALEVLRVSALLATLSGAISEVERGVLHRLAVRLGLDQAAVSLAMTEARSVLTA